MDWFLLKRQHWIIYQNQCGHLLLHAQLQYGGDGLTEALVNLGGALLLCEGAADTLLCVYHSLSAEDRVGLNQG